MKKYTLSTLLCASTILLSANSVSAATLVATTPETESDFVKALTEGKVLLDARYRYEYVNQDGLAHNANAHTLRTRLGYETGKFNDLSALIEVENIVDLAGESYNDTINGKTTYPTVSDPEDTNLNRLQLTYTGLPDTSATLGRQLINLDNQRFVGSVGWRQNDQTFDAISIKNQSLKDTTLFYAYSNQVNRIVGTNSTAGIWNNSDIHLFNASYTGIPFGKITGYAYLLDIPDSLSQSSATYGARFEGKQKIEDNLTGLLNLEYAHQTDYASNPNNVGFNYYSIEPGVTIGQWTIKGLYESIDGDGTSTAHAMQFPFGSNHAFDGWADKFLTTPANGLVDASIGVTYAAKSDIQYVDGTKMMLVYHDFSAERGGTDYGTEWDALVEQTFEKHYTAGVKFASYNADGLNTDTVKVMPYVQVKF